MQEEEQDKLISLPLASLSSSVWPTFSLSSTPSVISVCVPQISTALSVVNQIVLFRNSEFSRGIPSCAKKKKKTKLCTAASNPMGPDPLPCFLYSNHHPGLLALPPPSMIQPLHLWVLCLACSAQIALCSLFYFIQALLKGHLVKEAFPDYYSTSSDILP